MAERQPVAHQRASRIDDTLQTLFESLVNIEAIDPEDTQTLDYAHTLIDAAKAAVHCSDVSTSSEVNQAQDLIKRKLLRENSSPEKAARFSNLYSRLLATTVLSQKWAMLYLLLRISQTQPSDTPRVRQANDVEELQENKTPDYQIANHSYHPSASPPRHQDEAAAAKRATGRRSSVPAHSSVSQGYTHSRDGSIHPTPETSSPRRENHLDFSRDFRVIQSVKGISKSMKLENSAAATIKFTRELELLRNLPYNLQGLSSANLEFISSSTARLPNSLPIPLLSLLHTLTEPCLLFKSLSDFTGSHNGGLISQSLKAAINDELRSYLGLVATLEGEIRRALVALENGDTDQQSVHIAGVTLKRCVVWTRDATMGLRLMSLIVEESKVKRGGHIITLVHNLSSSHGDPFVGSFAERLLAHVARPFYEMLQRWIYDGELVDPYNEFFVVEADPSIKADMDPRRVVTSIWEDKYKLEDAMIPSIVSADFARKVFLIGKSLNFIRHNCDDSDWVVQYSQTHYKPLDYTNTSDLFTSIDDAYHTTMSRLTDLMSHKFLLFTHLEAMKKYLLLSQGDFMELLVESLAPNLDRSAHSQYRHTLTSQLEHAIRHSNAQYEDSEVLKRLDARMLELGRGDTGWDCFTLEYKISAPCDVVITQWASTQYLKIFNLLLRIKRVEYSLNSTWRRCMTGARGVLAAVGDKLDRDWKQARCAVGEMVHFINQLQYYVLYEVVEASWKDLQEATKKPNATLDDLIEAHTVYIKTITQKGLLSSTADREEAFLVQLHHLLRCMLNYRDAVDGLYSYSVAEFTRRQRFNATVEQRTTAGRWGITERDLIGSSSSPTLKLRPDRVSLLRAHDDSADSPMSQTSALLNTSDDASLLASIRSRLIQLQTEFKTRMSVMLYDLGHQPDVNMRFLGVVMNFNEFYKPVNRRRKDRERGKRAQAQSANASTVETSGGEND